MFWDKWYAKKFWKTICFATSSIVKQKDCTKNPERLEGIKTELLDSSDLKSIVIYIRTGATQPSEKWGGWGLSQGLVKGRYFFSFNFFYIYGQFENMTHLVNLKKWGGPLPPIVLCPCIHISFRSNQTARKRSAYIDFDPSIKIPYFLKGILSRI